MERRPRPPGEALPSGFFVWRVLTGNRYVLLAIASCVPLQLAHTHTPCMQRVFESADLSALEWGKVVVAGVLAFCVAESEKALIRRTGLAARRGHV